MRGDRSRGVRSLSRIMLLVVGLVSCVPQDAVAEQIIGLTTQHRLISFDSATPAAVTVIGQVTGHVITDLLVGIDRRPQIGPNNGKLYTMGITIEGPNRPAAARIYTLDETTAVATLVSTLTADPSDSTPPFPYIPDNLGVSGIDFNPVADRLRVTGVRAQNLRVNIDTGLVQLDVPLAFQSGDPNFGDAPLLVGAAYSNNFGGATSTSLRGFEIDERDQHGRVVAHPIPNEGSLQTLFETSLSGLQAFVGFDVSGLTGTTYMTASSPGNPLANFYEVGQNGVTLIGPIGHSAPVLGIAAPVGVPVPEPATATILCVLAALALLLRRK